MLYTLCMGTAINLLYLRRIISLLITVCFTVTGFNIPLVQAQDFFLPVPGVMVHLSPPFNPPILKGIKVHPDNPFRFDFILDKGDSETGNDQLKDESSKLIKYFLASLTIPEKDLWVNLSPYEKDRIIPNSFGLTEMGRDLLAEDYMLKQITASLIYPEGEVGKKFWKRIYEAAVKKYGTTDIPVNTFNKVWIVPEKAIVFENSKAGTAYVVESKLKVMLEQDYLSLEKHESIQFKQAQIRDTNQIGNQIVREIVIPELDKELNENKNFAKLRQVYNSLILATWYKKKIKDSILTQVYEGKNKVAGVSIDDPQEKEKIYQQYLKAFKKGAYNYIKEEIDPITQEIIPRKYFSGGMQFGSKMDDAMVVTSNSATLYRSITALTKIVLLGISLIVVSPTGNKIPNINQKVSLSANQVGEVSGVDEIYKIKLEAGVSYKFFKVRDEKFYYIEFNSLMTQNKAFNRLAIFVEDRQYHGKVLNDDEIKKIFGMNKTLGVGHDYDIKDIVRFFNQASRNGIKFNGIESGIINDLLKRGFIKYLEGRYIVNVPTAIISTSQDIGIIYPIENFRKNTIDHEYNHGIYFTDKSYREAVRKLWDSFPKFLQKAITHALDIGSDIDINDHDLVLREFAAWFRNFWDEVFDNLGPDHFDRFVREIGGIRTLENIQIKLRNIENSRDPTLVQGMDEILRKFDSREKAQENNGTLKTRDSAQISEDNEGQSPYLVGIPSKTRIPLEFISNEYSSYVFLKKFNKWRWMTSVASTFSFYDQNYFGITMFFIYKYFISFKYVKDHTYEFNEGSTVARFAEAYLSKMAAEKSPNREQYARLRILVGNGEIKPRAFAIAANGDLIIYWEEPYILQKLAPVIYPIPYWIAPLESWRKEKVKMKKESRSKLRKLKRSFEGSFFFRHNRDISIKGDINLTQVGDRAMKINGHELAIEQLSKDEYKRNHPAITRLINLIGSDVPAFKKEEILNRVDNPSKFNEELSFAVKDIQSDELVGVAIMVSTSVHKIELAKLSIDPQYQGLLMASWLIKTVFENAQSKGFKRAEWLSTINPDTTKPGSERKNTFYGKIGATLEGVIPPRKDAPIPGIFHYQWSFDFQADMSKLEDEFNVQMVRAENWSMLADKAQVEAGDRAMAAVDILLWPQTEQEKEELHVLTETLDKEFVGPWDANKAAQLTKQQTREMQNELEKLTGISIAESGQITDKISLQFNRQKAFIELIRRSPDISGDMRGLLLDRNVGAWLRRGEESANEYFGKGNLNKLDVGALCFIYLQDFDPKNPASLDLLRAIEAMARQKAEIRSEFIQFIENNFRRIQQIAQWDFIHRFPGAWKIKVVHGRDEEYFKTIVKSKQITLVPDTFFSYDPQYAASFAYFHHDTKENYTIIVADVPISSIQYTTWSISLNEENSEDEISVNGPATITNVFNFNTIKDFLKWLNFKNKYLESLKTIPDIVLDPYEFPKNKAWYVNKDALRYSAQQEFEDLSGEDDEYLRMAIGEAVDRLMEIFPQDFPKAARIIGAMIEDAVYLKKREIVGFIRGQFRDSKEDIEEEWGKAAMGGVKKDGAMMNSVQTNGGIDLTPADRILQSQNSGIGIKFHINAAQLARYQEAPGFTVEDITIQPLKSLPIWLGISQAQANYPMLVST